MKMSTQAHRGAPGLARRTAWMLPVLAIAGLIGCDDGTPFDPRVEPPPAPGQVLGVVEVTITRIGSAETESRAISAPTVAALDRLRGGQASLEGPLFSLSRPENSGGGGDGTIQLEPVSTGSFTDGQRGADGVRHVYATFRVRNAQSDGTAYDTQRTNLTFLAVDTDGTIGHTAFSRVDRFDGSAADPALAEAFVPGGAVHRQSGGVVATEPDVLQVLTEAQAGAVAAPDGVTDVFPYGFVVRRAAINTTRELLANPAADEFDGVITFSFKLPLQSSASDDPYTISVVFLAVDDSDTRITQSLEEQAVPGQSAYHDRASALGAITRTLLPKVAGFSGGAADEMFCEGVRIAGPAGNPTTTLLPAPDGERWLMTSSFDRGPHVLSRTARLAVAGCPAIATAGASNFTIHGFQSGRVSGAYTGVGTSLVRAPAPGGAGFFPGEEVEVTLTTALGGTSPFVARYRVTTSATALSYSGSSIPVPEDNPSSIAVGDLNGNGILDVVTTSSGSGGVSSLLGNGDGTFHGGQLFGDDFAGGNGNPWDAARWNVEETTGSIADLQGGFGRMVVGGPGSVGDWNDYVRIAAIHPPGATNRLEATITIPAGNDWFWLATLRGNGQWASGSGFRFFPAEGYWLQIGYHTPGLVMFLGRGDGGVTKVDLTSRPELDDQVSEWRIRFEVTGNTIRAAVRPASDGPIPEGEWDLQTTDATWTSPGVLQMGFGGSEVADNLHTLLVDDVELDGAQIFAVGSDPRSVAISDLNGDGSPDLAVANYGSGDVSVLLGNGSGGFQTQQTFAAGSNPHSVTIGDLNGDGILDLAVANQGSHDVSVLLGNGNGTFQTQQTFAVGSNPQSIAIGDLNGNGILDLAVANNASNSVTILLGNGNGTFQSHQSVAGSGPRSIAVGDLNGDGALDVAVANDASNNVSVLLGNGDGTFQTHQTFAAGTAPSSLAISDLNGNGVLDLAVANATSNDVSVLLGNGNGTFQTHQPFAAGAGPVSVALGDLNGSGVLDIIVANNGAGTLSVLLNP